MLLKEHSDKIEKMLEKYRNTCDDAVTDQTFDFHAVNGQVGQSDAVARLEHTLYMTPKKETSLQVSVKMYFFFKLGITTSFY